jgi:hypothetical protein
MAATEIFDILVDPQKIDISMKTATPTHSGMLLGRVFIVMTNRERLCPFEG